MNIVQTVATRNNIVYLDNALCAIEGIYFPVCHWTWKQISMLSVCTFDSIYIDLSPRGGQAKGPVIIHAGKVNTMPGYAYIRQ